MSPDEPHMALLNLQVKEAELPRGWPLPEKAACNFSHVGMSVLRGHSFGDDGHLDPLDILEGFLLVGTTLS